MDTKKEIFRYIILVPHRDAARALEEYRHKLFSGAVPGAHSFPAASPLAEVSSPFSREELRELSGSIRRLIMENNGKTLNAGANRRSESGIFLFFGPVLNLAINERSFPESATGKISKILSPPLLCAALLNPAGLRFLAAENSSAKEIPVPEDPPSLSFRAAALANLAIRPLKVSAQGSASPAELSYEWRLGPLVWLPKRQTPICR